MKKLIIGLLLSGAVFAQSLTLTGPGAAASASSGITLVTGAGGTANNCAGGVNSATTSAVDASTANFAVVFTSVATGATAVTDSNGNGTPTSLTATVSTPVVNIHFWYPFTGSTTQTFTSTLSAGFQNICAFTYSGLTTGFDTGKESTNTVTGGASVKPGALTPSAASSLLVTTVGYQSNGGSVVNNNLGAGFIVGAIKDLVSNVNYGNAAAYKIEVGGPSSADPQWDFTPGNDTGGSKMAVFK